MGKAIRYPLMLVFLLVLSPTTNADVETIRLEGSVIDGAGLPLPRQQVNGVYQQRPMPERHPLPIGNRKTPQHRPPTPELEG